MVPTFCHPKVQNIIPIKWDILNKVVLKRVSKTIVITSRYILTSGKSLVVNTLQN